MPDRRVPRLQVARVGPSRYPGNVAAAGPGRFRQASAVEVAVVLEHGAPPSAQNSLLSPGVVITGSTVSTSVLSPACYIDEGAEVTGSVLLPGVRVGAGAVVRNAIIDKFVDVPPGATIGVDAEADVARGFKVESGLTVLAKGQEVPG